MNLSNNIYTYRTANNWSQAELADMLALDSEKAKYWLEKYLQLTNDPLEQAELDNFEYACKRMMKSRRSLVFYTNSRSCSRDLPENRGSLDDSFYDKFRENA